MFDLISIESVSVSVHHKREKMRTFIWFLLASLLALSLATDGIKINLCCPSGEILTEVRSPEISIGVYSATKSLLCLGPS